MVGVTILFSVLPLVVVSPSDYWRYFLEVVPTNSSRFMFFLANLSVFSVINRFLSNGPWVVLVFDVPQLICPLT